MLNEQTKLRAGQLSNVNHPHHLYIADCYLSCRNFISERVNANNDMIRKLFAIAE